MRRLVTRPSFSLLAKLLVVQVGLSVLAVGATGLLTYQIAREALRRQIIGAGQEVADSFARANALEWLDERRGPLNLRIQLAGLLDAEHRRLLAGYAVDRDRKVIASVGAATMPLESMRDIVEGRSSVSRGDGTLTVVSPVVYDRVTLGYTALVFDDGILAGAGAKVMWRSGLVIAVLVLADVLALVLVLRTVLRPVVELGHAAREIAAGNYSYRLRSRLDEDEIGDAGRSFNAMCDALELHMRFSNAALVDRIRTGSGIEAVLEPRLSVVFGDAQDYTRWSQRQRPAAIFRILNRYFTTFGRVTVGRYGGIIDKFMGDGVMAYFGLGQERGEAPEPQRSVRDALRATIYSQMALRILAESLRLEGVEPLQYRFGIASGRCLVGPIGARDILLDYSLIGQVVNLASRLEGQAPPGGVAIDRFTLRDAGEDFLDVSELGKQRIRGLDSPVEVFVVRGLGRAEDVDALRSFLCDELLADPALRSALLDGDGAEARLDRLRTAIAREARRRPFLPG